MQKYYKPARVAAIFIVMSLLAAVYLATLYRLQIYDTSADADAWLARNTTSQTMTLAADRGDILDRNGVVLVSTRPCYNVTLSREVLLERDDINKIILSLIYDAVDNGISYTDTFPVTMGAPFTYLSDMTDSQRKRLETYMEYFKIPKGISASDLIVWMKKHYGIDYTTNISDARLIIGVRYEMELRAVMSLNPYVFASDVGTDFLTLIKERHYPGVNIEASAQRVYHTTYAAHLLGYTGLMTQAEYESTYKEMGYSYNSVVGKAGAELAFEKYLHGTDGLQVVTTSDDGAVVDVRTIKDPVPGSNVYLSIDIGLQAVCEDSLAAKIELINAEREAEDRVTGGAVVVVDVRTGEVLACCSYPTFSLQDLSKNISDLLRNESHPLFNRATQGKYNPGSTFKMVTALAGLKAGAINRSTIVNCTGKYVKYEDFQPVCWIYGNTGHGHGPENVVTALRDSCNIFFYWLGDTIGIDAISETAAEFGFGSKTGIEIPESPGVLATPEYKREVVGEKWYASDNILTAIGQGYNQFTPVQLASYVSTIANGGTRYALTMLGEIRSADYTKVVCRPERKVVGKVSGGDYIGILQEGMRLVASEGTASSIFKSYKVPVAAKTGTVQLSSTAKNAKLNNGVFVCYAPADNPEIAISLVVEKGTSGSTIMQIAKDIMDYYFREKAKTAVASDNSILP